VKGLVVALSDQEGSARGSATTDTRGVAQLSSEDPMEGWKATIDDVDGTNNGGSFAEAQVLLDGNESYTVELKRK